ncbi:DUF1715-domain-containing protein [Nadsonia fulvescens var. elongata DSM 6958]|uniref:DUF1715-domain-containing protein n=1 Tax=Nadsonia fulvescens var. elongata DSM 6958 TaxID=857566 RepID=A0A1E3PI67_9ASCO|nr:DUF1715-domain-containing protein [Nadsonia fulvescens var. elongata DSM 6958]
MPATRHDYGDLLMQRTSSATPADLEDVFEDVLNLEDKYYHDGYNEGYRDGLKSGFLEGKEYGIQTGFQRLVDFGILQGRLKVWQHQIASATVTSGGPANERQIKRIQQLQQLLPETVALSNDDADVEDYERRMKKAIARAKTLAATFKGTPPLRLDDSLVGLRREDETIEEGY